jgi:hypothetical protein
MNKRNHYRLGCHCPGNRLVRVPTRVAVCHNKTVSEEFPGGPAMVSIEKGPIAVTKGNFKGLAHETKGLASIYQLADSKRTLRLSEFATSNGPDVHVYLVAAEVEKGNDAVKEAGFIDLGSMKGNIGDQNYDTPPTPTWISIGRFRSGAHASG